MRTTIMSILEFKRQVFVVRILGSPEGDPKSEKAAYFAKRYERLLRLRGMAMTRAKTMAMTTAVNMADTARQHAPLRNWWMGPNFREPTLGRAHLVVRRRLDHETYRNAL